MAEKKVDNVIINVGFSEEQELKELKSGERLSVLMGKLAKGVKDLVTHLADNVKHVTAAERTTWNGKAAGNHTHNAATSSANGFMSVADKIKLDELENYDDSDIKDDISALQTNKADKKDLDPYAKTTGGVTFKVGDVKNNYPNKNVFHITQSSGEGSGIYFDGNEEVHASQLLENGNIKLSTSYNYYSSKYEYIGEEFTPDTIAASNLINGVAFYKNYDSDRNFRVYATKRGTTQDLNLGTSNSPWTHIYAENIHCTNPPWASAASINDIELAMCDLYESMNKEDT